MVHPEQPEQASEYLVEFLFMHATFRQPSQVTRVRSWRFYAVVTFAVTLLLACGAFVALHFYRQSLIREYTSATPARLQLIAISGNDRQALQEKWSRFSDELSQGRATAPLTMSSKELNSFISMIPELKDTALLGIEGDRIRVDYAVPLDALGLNGRYANGVALLEIGLGADSLPTLDLVSVKLNGKQPPASILSRLDTGGLDKVRQVLRDAPVWKDLESIDIRDGLLVFSPKNPK